jgi:signal transduction histidine kinase
MKVIRARGIGQPARGRIAAYGRLAGCLTLLLLIVLGSPFLGARASREEAALAFAKRYLHTLESTQEFYAHAIFPPGKPTASEVGSFPAPAVFAIELGEYLRCHEGRRENLSFRLYSSRPFAKRERETLLPIEEKAMTALEGERAKAFQGRITLEGEPRLFYAEPVRMSSQACVDCHNTHPASMKTDWAVGDVRGVRAVYLPLGLGDGFVRATLLRLGVLPFALFLAGAVPLLLMAAWIERGYRRRILLAALRVRDAMRRERAHRLAELRASRAKDLFIARLSHELRNPINLVVGFAELVQNQSPGHSDGPVHRYLRSILGAGQRLLLLVNDILDTQKVELGALDVHKRDCALRPVVEDVMEMMSLGAEQQSIRLTHDVTVERGFIAPRLLKQILVNLISNGIKYSRPNGSVHLSISMLNAKDLRVAVEDDGLGMTPEEVERALTPYFRVHAKDHPTIEGTGLSLLLCKSMAEAMDGRFTVSSEKGAGTRIEILFPPEPEVERVSTGAPLVAALSSAAQ